MTIYCDTPAVVLAISDDEHSRAAVVGAEPHLQRAHFFFIPKHYLCDILPWTCKILFYNIHLLTLVTYVFDTD